MPTWIIDGDETNNPDGTGGNLRKLTQIMASYLDNLDLTIGELPKFNMASYPSSSVAHDGNPDKVFEIYPTIQTAFFYETLSETNFNYSLGTFKANTYFDISKFMSKKLKILKIFKSEISKHPFPRSAEAVKALATLRGSESGYYYAEAFQQIFKKL